MGLIERVARLRANGRGRHVPPREIRWQVVVALHPQVVDVRPERRQGRNDTTALHGRKRREASNDTVVGRAFTIQATYALRELRRELACNARP